MISYESLDLLFKEIEDPYVRENFYKLKRFLERQASDSSTTTISGGTVPGSGSAGTSPWVLGDSPVPSGATVVLDSRPLTGFACAYYQLCFKENGGVKTKTLKIDIRKVDMDIEDQVYAKNGDAMNISVTAVIVGTNMELQITNNEAFGIDAKFARLTL